ncbi:MAG: RNA polymerase sigma factor [Chitinophagaceae bacterium]
MPENLSNLQDDGQLLIKGCMAGERSAQAKLYHLFARKMMGVCMWYARNKQEAEEILQDGFMRVFTYMHTYHGNGSLEGWIRKIMVNAVLFKYRNKSMQLKPVIELNPDKHEAVTTVSFTSELDAKEMMLLVQQLPPTYRMVFSLHVLEGYKHREIAAILGISEGTSKSNLADARTWMQKVLSPKKKIAAI